MVLVRAAVALLLMIAMPSLALAEKRVALVIGNGAYKHTGELTNPKNDAADVGAALRQLGFQVLEGFDLDKAAFDRKVRDFADALQGAEVGLLFYAGHGLQVVGTNYLVPVDAQLTTAAALEFEMVRLDVIHRVMERQTNTNILFLDACRDNPLARNLARAMGARSGEVGRGLAAVESGVGTLISFSTQPGNVALDGSGRNSPFAGALVKHISAREDLSAILISVRNDVMKETQRKQVPWEHSALTGRFYFDPSAQAAAPSGKPAPLSEAAEAWDRTKDTTSVAVLEDFIARYKETFYARLASARIEELKSAQVAVAVPPKVPPAVPPKPAEPTVAVAPAPPARCEGVEVRGTAVIRVVREKDLGTLKSSPDIVCLKPGAGQDEGFKDCPTCPEMVVIPAGEFMMGSPKTEHWHHENEGPQHKVTIDRPFAVGRFAVTRGEFAAFVRESKHSAADKCRILTEDVNFVERSGRSFRNPGFAQDDQHPVVCVNWDDAQAFVAWLYKKTGRSYRLLTEAEREYVARAGTTTPFWLGASISTAQANYSGTANAAKGEYRQKTVPVDSFEPNPWGLYNVHGNVWEWVEDCWHNSYQGAPSDASAWTVPCRETVLQGGIERVLRGGAWNFDTRGLRSAYRIGLSPAKRSNTAGFRVAITFPVPRP